MRILWFANTPSMYDTIVNGGGWIASLERILRKRSDCEIGIAFEYDKPNGRESRDNVTYYPIYEQRSRIRERYVDSYTFKYRDKFLLEESRRIIDDFKPDIIHVWGSEWCFGLLAKKTEIPIVIHMQGCWPVYKNVIDSVKSTRTLWDYMHETWKPQLWWSFVRKQHLSEMRAKREEEVLSINRHFMGRTRWDKAIVSLYAPTAKYFYCSEALRESFVNKESEWKLHGRDKCTLITVANTDMIKGYDFIFQTARIIKEHAPFKCEWKLVGNGEDSLWLAGRKTGIRLKDINVTPYGQLPAEAVLSHLADADIFVQPSYIDNSPNAVCEAQYIGLPIIATNVGGVPSLFDKEYDSDLFVPLHDPWYLAAKIIELFVDKKKMQKMSELNKTTARKRHSDEEIEKDLLYCYDHIIEDNKRR